MANRVPQLPNSIKQARLSIENYREITVIRDFYWFEPIKSWVQLVELKLDSEPHPHFPNSTDWYVVCSSDYPFGEIRFFPSKQSGLMMTFPHQALIEQIQNPKIPWNKGHPCLSAEFDSAVRSGFGEEPRGEGRLGWNYARLIEWGRRAKGEKLFLPGDRFELPATSNLDVEPPFAIVQEDEHSFEKWSSIEEEFGLIQGHRYKTHLVVDLFQDAKRQPLLSYKWNKELQAENEASVITLGIWCKLNEVPLVGGWQAPRTWAELLMATSMQGLDLLTLYRKLISEVGFGESFIFSFSFPIPKEVDGPNVQRWWWHLSVPSLKHQLFKGFRKQSLRSLLNASFSQLLVSDRKLNWITTKNFDRERFGSRGGFKSPLRAKNILIVGSGAIGSVAAEILCRGGCESITIADYDRLDFGNLSRHLLTLRDLGRPKAEALAERLQSINPFCNVVAHRGSAFEVSEESRLQYDLIIDTTGDDDVISWLEHALFNAQQIKLSLSVGFKGQRLYYYLAREWSARNYFACFQSEIRNDVALMKAGAPAEGLGCWHYAFPASASRIWSLVSLALGHLDDNLNSNKSSDKVIFEHVTENGHTSVETREVHV